MNKDWRKERITKAIIAWFWSRVNKNGPVKRKGLSCCWEWATVRAWEPGPEFRGPAPLAYRIQKGVIPKGKFVLHRCDNERCVRGSHLEAGTQSKNVLDAIKRTGAQLGVNRWRWREYRKPLKQQVLP